MSASQYQTDNGCKVYKPKGYGNIEIVKKNGLYVIENLGISSMALKINDNPIAFEKGKMEINADKIKHIPHCYKCGEIVIE